eukprot:3098764-Rhodomonas_salina.5
MRCVVFVWCGTVCISRSKQSRTLQCTRHKADGKRASARWLGNTAADCHMNSEFQSDTIASTTDDTGHRPGARANHWNFTGRVRWQLVHYGAGGGIAEPEPEAEPDPRRSTRDISVWNRTGRTR